MVTYVAIATAKFLFGMCACTANSDVDTGDFSLVLGNLHVCGHVHVRSHVSQGMDCRRLSVTCSNQRQTGGIHKDIPIHEIRKNCSSEFMICDALHKGNSRGPRY